MGDKTGISWTNATWNPITGCSRVSEGCRNCYAERFAHRFSGKGQRYEGLTHIANGHPAWTGKIDFNEKALLKPLSWKSPRRIFVNSMSDLFHEHLDVNIIDKVFAVMALTPHHTYQVLTKRPERMLSYLTDKNLMVRWGFYASAILGKSAEDREPKFPIPNVWLGTSVENQRTADERIPLLLQTPAAVRFISAEPLLGPVSLSPVADDTYQRLSNWYAPDGSFDPTGSQPTKTRMGGYVARLDWVICGGESGPGARPMNPEWARSLLDQCKSAGIPFFFKQWGAWVPRSMACDIIGDDAVATAKKGTYAVLDGEFFHRVGARKAGCLLDGVEHHEFPRVSA